ncbi:hypothetical protein HYT57_03790 [Candidatus Woesearchaeota archaeon]|nr:hypothetical protein [Candidatus Woesearchaeota archaeon]
MRNRKITLDNVLDYKIRDFRGLFELKEYTYNFLRRVRTVDDILAEEEGYGEEEKTLILFFSEIKSVHEGVRQSLCNLKRDYLKYTQALKKSGISRRPIERTGFVRLDLVKETDNVKYKRYVEKPKRAVVRNSGRALSELCTLWDNTAETLWYLYEADMPFIRARFPDIYGPLKDRKELQPFFRKAGVKMSRDENACLQEGILKELITYRNNIRHGMVGISRAFGYTFSAVHEGHIKFHDHKEDKTRLIRVMTPEEWIELTVRSYHHFVECYNTLLGGLKNLGDLGNFKREIEY